MQRSPLRPGDSPPTSPRAVLGGEALLAARRFIEGSAHLLERALDHFGRIGRIGRIER